MSNEAAQYVPGFEANLKLMPQQANSRLVQGVLADLNHTKPGTLFNADDLDVDNEPELEVTTRIPNSPEGEFNHLRRVGFFKAFQKGKFLEDLEVVRMLEDPTSAGMASMMNAKHRATDDFIIDGMFAPSRNGQNGETAVAFPGANIIDVTDRSFLHDAEVVPGSGNLPLTIGKLIAAKVRLDETELEGDRFFACSAVQLGNLLSSTPATSSDYANVKRLAEGDTNTFMGFTFIRSQRLKSPAANVRRCAAWIKDALQYKERPIKNARITQREDKSYRWYAYYEVERGMVRRYDAGVLGVDCAENVF
ncbi:phage capsid protein [Phenylobacterium sp. SCN 70-31]|uniref:phage capsid protein n=1 Tax=Phenylobacterium sp. SCN 70-31 TaxID=1660129 RepID=UPI0025CD6D09|nr:phage capsid protein [Phenylobacterium sp. SCN 70-31]